MKTRLLRIGDISLTVPEEWDDITATLDDPNAPITIAKPVSGAGALQISLAIYKSGALPHITKEVLQQLLTEFAASRGLEAPFDQVGYPGSTFALGESFRSADDYVRVSYCTDGTNLALVTYVCDWTDKTLEAEAIEEMIRSLCFVNR